MKISIPITKIKEVNFLGKALFLIFGLSFSCDEFVQVEPPLTKIVSATVFEDDATATSAVRGIYSEMGGTFGIASGSPSSLTSLGGLSSDELIDYSSIPDRSDFYFNSILPTNSTLKNSLWGEAYTYIFYANSILEGLSESAGVTSATRRQLEGEAKFIRAFYHFYLLNLFGAIPIVTTTDYQVNRIAGRSSADKVYEQIINDLKDSENFLAEDYSFSGGERVRPNKWVAIAFLARVYLYHQDWINSEIQATKIIDNKGMFELVDLSSIFLKNSQETIWQLMPVIQGLNTLEGYYFFLGNAPVNVALNPDLVDAFEVNDMRKENWVGVITSGGNDYYYPYKYRIQAGSQLREYSMVLRLSEQYLIRSEARAQNQNVSGSQADLNVIRNRGGLASTTAQDRESLLRAIEQERRIELFSEWGHRWLDLKRTGRIDDVLVLVKPDWESTDQLYPIPETEISNNSNLAPQNAGY